jgi:N-formylglutamate amidohydrolase
MQRPDNLNDALRHLHNLTMAIANDLTNYMDNPQDYKPEYFEDVHAAALDAHLLVTWVRDNLAEMNK